MEKPILPETESKRAVAFAKAAFKYRAKGWHPIPLRPRSKAPAVRVAEFLQRPATDEEFASWSFDGGVGIATGPVSGLLVLDADGPGGMEELKRRGHPPTPAASTPGGGMHLFFEHPGFAVGTKIRIAENLDAKARGGYVVAAPSIAATGKKYKWLPGMSPEDIPPAPAPEWLLELLQREQEGRRGPAPPAGEKIPQGQRNRALASIAGTLRRRGLVAEEIFPTLKEANERRCKPPLPESEVWKIAESMEQYPPAADASPNGHRDRPVDEPSGYKQGGNPKLAPTHDELRDAWIETAPNTAHGMGEWRRYENGVWPAVSEMVIRGEITDVLEAAKPEGVKPTASLLASVGELSKVKRFVLDARWDADPNLLVLGNGTLDIQAGQLLEHRPEHYATGGLAYDYDPDMRAVQWAAFLKDTLAKETTDFMQEFAGYCLTTSTEHELALWLHGPPGGGKSTFLAGLQAMLGHRAVALGLADLEKSRFGLAEIMGRTLAVASEQPSAFLGSTNILNTLISGEPLQIERKYQQPFTFTPRVKMVWALNELPRVADANSGLFRRIRVVGFPAIDEGKRDPAVKRQIDKEGAGILVWALEGLRRLNERGHFEVPNSVASATRNFQETNDVPGMFIEEACIRGTDHQVQAAVLYGAYKSWCEENGHRPQSSTRVAADWTRLGLTKTTVNGRKVYAGVMVRLAG